MSVEQRGAVMALVRAAEQLERYDDMIKYVKDYIGMNAHLSPDDRAVFGAAYKQFVKPIRNHLAFLDLVLAHLNSKQDVRMGEAVKRYRDAVLEELNEACKDLIDVVGNRLMPNTQSVDDQIFYLALKGDFYRYMCEFADEKGQWDPSNNAMECYEKALEHARKHLMPVNPMVLNLVMNYCVFLAEILDRKDDAIAETKKLLKSIHETIEDNGKEVVTDDAKEIIKKIRANVDIWMKQDEIL